MSEAPRTGYVQFQQRLARMALDRGQLGAARAALRVLRTSDFFGGAAVSEGHLAVIREQRSSEADLREAIAALLRLRPAGSGRPS
jgi:hypothetical protein